MGNTDCNVGYFIECDLEVPCRLHDFLDQLPIGPEMKSPAGSSCSAKVNKLMLTHEKKTHYTIHHRLLEFYKNLGVRICKVHRAVSFEETPVFKSYVDYNTAKRASSTSAFHKAYYKLKNNSLYGKCVENIRKRMDLRLVNSPERFEAYTSKPSFKKSILIDDDLLALLMRKESIKLDRPVFIGQAVLDLSKLRMYQLHYVELEKYRRKFNCQLNIVAGDTDSFFLECQSISLRDRLLPAMIRDGLLDTSNYQPDDPLYSRLHANEIGLVKDESGGALNYAEWVFLRPKCYSLLCYDDTNQKKAKGVQKNVLKRGITYADYLRVYRDPEEVEIVRKQRRIESRQHQLYTTETSKRVMGGGGDDKRFWLPDGNNSLALGHWRIDDDDTE